MDRRDALRRLGGLAALTAAGGGLSACSPERSGTGGPAALRIPRAELVPGARLRVTVGAHPVELVDRDGTVTGRSLLCTHFGCEVRWQEEADEYHCPCHEGRFDAGGRPIAGPPKTPLRVAVVTVEGDMILVEVPVDEPSP